MPLNNLDVQGSPEFSYLYAGPSLGWIKNFIGTTTAPTGGNDSSNLQSLMNGIASAGGGTLMLTAGRYQIQTTITVPTNVVLIGGGDPIYNANNTLNYTSQVFVLVVSPAATISMSAGSSLKNLGIQSSLLFTPASIQDNINMVAAFAGTAITIAGSEVLLENIFCIGFNTLISSSGNPRLIVNKFYGDGTNGIVLDNSHDISRFHSVHLWPFVTANSTFTIFNATITGAVDNGSGLYRLTVNTQSTIITGNTVYVNGVGGALGANGIFTATVVNPTTIDLQGSATVPSFTATATSGNAQLTGVSSFANLVQGQAISGTNVAGGATIKTLWPSKSIVVMSATATGSGATTVTVTNGAYTSGGRAQLLTGVRSGTGIKVTNSDVNVFVDCFVLGYSIDYSVGVGCNWETFIGCNADTIVPAGTPGNTAIGLQLTGSCKGTQWIGGSMQAVGTSIQCTSTSSEPHVISGADLNSAILGNGVAVDHQTGDLIINACTSGVPANLLIADTAGQFNMSGCTVGNWVFNWQSNTGVGVTKITGSNFLGSGSTNLVFQSPLPTSDPHILNRWWSNAGVVTVSAG